MSDREAACAWRVGLQERVCDRIETLPSGAAVFASAYPDYYDFNCLRLERTVQISADEIAAVADRLYDGYGHRKVEIYDFGLGERLKPRFDELGWHSDGLVWMVHDGPAPAIGEDVRPAPASDDEARPIRLTWVEPPHTAEAVAAHMPTDEEVGRLLGARNLVLRGDDGAPIAFTRYLLHEDLAEVQNVYVLPEHRGRGLGGHLTSATVAQALADGARRVFILADAFGRPQHLYARLGFRPVMKQYDFTRILRFPGSV